MEELLRILEKNARMPIEDIAGTPRAAHVRPLQLYYFAFTYAPNAFGTGYTSAKSSAAAQT